MFLDINPIFMQVILEFLQVEFLNSDISVRKGQNILFHAYNGDVIIIESNHDNDGGWIIIGALDGYAFMEVFSVIRPEVSRYAQYSTSYTLEYANPVFLDTLQHLISEFFRNSNCSSLPRY